MGLHELAGQDDGLPGGQEASVATQSLPHARTQSWLIDELHPRPCFSRVGGAPSTHITLAHPQPLCCPRDCSPRDQHPSPHLPSLPLHRASCLHPADTQAEAPWPMETLAPPRTPAQATVSLLSPSEKRCQLRCPRLLPICWVTIGSGRIQMCPCTSCPAKAPRVTRATAATENPGQPS